MRSLLREVRLASRTFVQAPWFATGIILTLALGIGANVAIFSLLHAVLLQRLPYQEPNDVVMVWTAFKRPESWQSSTTGGSVLSWKQHTTDVLDDLAGIKLRAAFPADLVLPDRAERLRTGYVTPNFFDILRVRPLLGRLFTAADDAAESGPLLVLSHSLWREAFGADPGVIGRSVTLNLMRAGPKAYSIAAVLPPEFRFTYPLETQVWIVQRWSEVRQDAATRSVTHDGAIGRLKAGVTLEAARARLEAVNDQIFPPRPDTPPELRRHTWLQPVHEWVVGETRPALLLLGGVAGLLFFATCATVSSALFVRVTRRQREIGVRAALGADRIRLLAQLTTEGAVLALAGTAAGTLIATAIHPLLRAIVPPTVPRADEIAVSLPLLAFAAAAAGAVTVLATLAPAWRGATIDVVSLLKRGSGSASADRSSVRWRKALIATQAAIASALIVSAALLLMSFWRLVNVPLGFDPEGVLAVELRVVAPQYRQPTALLAFRDDLIGRIRSIPGVTQVSVATAAPFRPGDSMYRLDRSDATAYNANGRAVDREYFEILGIPLLRGRLFAAEDIGTAPGVAVVSESFARAAFGAEDPLGQVVEFDKPAQIVGIVGDVRYVGFDKDPYPAFYRPATQMISGQMSLLVRTAPHVADVGAAIRRAVREVDPSQPVLHVMALERIIGESVADRRFYTTATAAFALVALLLTLVGLTVVVARAVVERRKEFAIRAALGATPARLVRAIVTDGMPPMLAGTAAGLIAAYTASTVLSQFLFNTPARDPLTYVSAATLIVATAALASWIPASRAADKAIAATLRSDY
jgi:predicted permease